MVATTTAMIRGITDLGSGWPWRMARWLLAHSMYAVTATTAPNTMSGTPSRCQP